MEKQHITTQAVRQVLHYYWLQYKRFFIAAIPAASLPALGTILTNFVPPLIVARLVNIVAAGEKLTINTVGGHVALFTGAWLLGEIFWRLGMHLIIKLEAEGMNSLGKIGFNRLTELDHDFYSDNFVGSLTKKNISFVKGFEALTEVLIFNVVTNILPIIFAGIVLWRFSPWIPIILAIAIAITVAIAIPIVRRRSKLVAARHDAGSRVAGRVSDSITNILAVKSFAREKEEQRTHGHLVDDYTEKFKAAANYQNLRFDMFITPMYVVTNAIGLVAALFFTNRFGLEVGVMVIIFSYFQQITRAFWEINHVYRSIESAVSEAAEFTQLLINPPRITDVPNAQNLQLTDMHVEFTDVGFTYRGQQKKNDEDTEENLFLSQFNLEIKGSQRVGLVGPSGGGKTTITKLLLRFIDPQVGEIRIDGQNIKTVSQKSLRDAIAYVPQEPLLFHRSLFENIAYGHENATEAEVIEAAKLARAHEFIEVLPKGYQTLVGERGIKLSGGQRQRVAIARAILKKAPILVLDEATSSLDSESEKYIQEGLWELMKNKTALVIAHRLSTIKHLDRIIVLEHGKIVQDGTHEELIAKKGLYATLWSHQSGEFLEE